MHVSKYAGEGETDSYFVKRIQHSDLHHDADWLQIKSQRYFSLYFIIQVSTSITEIKPFRYCTI